MGLAEIATMTDAAPPSVPLLDHQVHAPITGLFVITVTLVFAFAAMQPLSQVWLFEHMALHPVRQPGGGQLHQFLSYAVLHLFFVHWLTNTAALMIIGVLVEARMTRASFGVFLAGAAMFAGLAHALGYPQSDIGLLGSSGIIAALVGGQLSLTVPRGVLRYALWLFGILALMALGIAIVTGNQPPVQAGDAGHTAHVAGLAFGIVWCGALTRKPDLAPLKPNKGCD